MKIPKILIFNFITKQFSERFGTVNLLGRRLKSMSLDFSFMISLIFPFMLILTLPTLFLPSDIMIRPDNLLYILPNILPFTLCSMIIINKDFFRAKSIAKRYYGYQIIDAKTSFPATETQCLIRNCTMIIWPIEVVVSLLNPTKRIGDFIAGTKLIDSNIENPELIMNEINASKAFDNKKKVLWISVLIALFFSIISILPIFIVKI